MIEKKISEAPSVGFTAKSHHKSLYPFQLAAVVWACRKGRAALFEDCGLGKTRQQIAWAQAVCDHTGGEVLILAPLAVSEQTVREGAAMGISITHARTRAEVGHSITITNYERLASFADREWAGVVIDESSIIKSYDGALRNQIIASFSNTPYRLACTATPAPNDHMELGNHAEFLGILTRTEMLATYFVHDGGDTSEWRLKGHAERDFWRWVASWAIMIRKPSDIGFSDEGFELPPITYETHICEVDVAATDTIFAMPAKGLGEQRVARRETMAARTDLVAQMVAVSPEPWLVWCELNDEGDGLEKAIPGSIQVAGANSEEDKADRMLGFADGRHRVMVTKPKIAGFGMNWQHCRNIAFVGLSNSYEQFYQAVRRCYRFGQKLPVHVHVISTDIEAAVLANINRKQADADRMAEGMILHMRDVMDQELKGTARTGDTYRTATEAGKGWTMHLGDCVESIGAMPDASIHYSIFSPPFASLYTYSASAFDMGNCRSHDEFMSQFSFLIPELLRVTMPGRLLSFHCMNLPISKERDGVIGITDFRGKLIRAFTDAGWIFHSEVCIWKDPVTAMQRTKALGLLHKTIRKDSAMSRQGIADYLVTMRKPGGNPEPIPHGEDLPVSLWQRYASPVWMDINPSNTLQRTSAREEADERHICPLQLDVIERCLHLWSNPGDLVLSPFAGIGSEGVSAIKMRRRFVGCELKESYWKQASRNLTDTEQTILAQQTIFGDRAILSAVADNES